MLPPPAFRRATYSRTTWSMGLASRTFSLSPSEMRPTMPRGYDDQRPGSIVRPQAGPERTGRSGTTGQPTVTGDGLRVGQQRDLVQHDPQPLSVVGRLAP